MPRICTTIAPNQQCPLPDDCWCEQEDRRRRAFNVTLFMIVLIVLGAATLIASCSIIDRALSAEPCLTEKQARAKYSGQHLYWRTAQKCWSNIPPAAKRADKEPLTADVIDQLQYREEAERRLRTCCWPPIPGRPSE